MAAISTSTDNDSDLALQSLLTAEAVRERCARIGTAAEAGRGRWFRYLPDRLEHCVDLVANECRANYPDLEIPFHSRWRHFEINGTDLWQHYRDNRLAEADREVITRSAIDLVVLSVILDAGAGAAWTYRDPVTGSLLSRSEGLAAATIDLFFNTLARDDGEGGLMLDATAISTVGDDEICRAFQHHSENPLLGMAGRIALLRSLGQRLTALRATGFARPGHIYDRLLAANSGGQLPAGEILKLVLHCFNPIWPSGRSFGGVILGDCGVHPLADVGDACGGLVPFHKLSQWLSYSLIEPLSWAGLQVTEPDQLTGLPEYRNGGLLLDSGVLQPLDPDLYTNCLPLDHEAVVEWRALTVWLLDRVALGVRHYLGMEADDLPLASVLQGGTWSAGRKLAAERRGGDPPLKLAIDGTVF